MRVVVSLVLILSVILGWEHPAAAERVSQEPPRVEPLSTGPARSLPYVSGQPIPPGYHLVQRPRTGLIITGAVTYGVTYGFTAGVGFLVGLIDSAVRDDKADEKYLSLMIPVAGPILFGVLDHDVHPILVVDSLVQAGGLALLIYGASTKSRTLVRDSAAIGGIAPMPMAGGSGVVLSGTF